MSIETDMKKFLPMNTFKEIPTPKPDAKEIVGLVKEKGRIAGYQLSNDQMVTKEEGIAMARQGEIRGVGIASRKGNPYLRSLPDENQNNNLGNLPSVTKGQINQLR